MKQKIFEIGLVSIVIIGTVGFLLWDSLSSQIEIGGGITQNTAAATITPEIIQEYIAAETIEQPRQTAANEKIDTAASKIVTKEGSEFPLYTYKPLAAPNDPRADQSWVRTANIDDIWGDTAGAYQTTLAIIDTGFALDHEELSGRLAENAGEVGSTLLEAPSDLNCSDQSIALDKSCNNIDDDGDGQNDNESGPTTFEQQSFLNCTDQAIPVDKSCNLLDDDSNGLIDDARGFDFINFDRSAQAGDLNPTGTGIHHGSYVSGAAAANNNNNLGIAGTDPSTKLLLLQALDDDSFGHSVSVGRAVRYAAQQGADVISISLGTDSEDTYMRSAIEDAMKLGSIVVAATGNDGCDCIVYPANFAEVVAVGASNSSFAPYTFSNFGANLDILAPGAGFYTLDWSASNETSLYADNIAGTSLATPVVAGTLTRLKSHLPNASNLELIAALTESTNRTGLSNAHSGTRGYGSLDALKAYNRVTTALNIPLLYGISNVSAGEVTGLEPAPVGHTQTAYECSQNNRTGTTPIYEVDNSYYTASQTEWRQERANGKTAVLFARLCLLLPHDQVNAIRTLNPDREF